MSKPLEGQGKQFRLEEATIGELHQAIRAGNTSCLAVVQHYIKRVRAYNGVASMLVTEDGAEISEAYGTIRAMAPIRFPTRTVKASSLLPDLDKYKGPPLEYGRMEATASDPSKQQQFGMIVGIPNAGQVNALATLNIRGERSVTCRGDFDLHPSKGPLPKGAPPACEFFRHLPDALERAAELDATYGRNPNLEQMPMYGVVFSFKDPFDTKDRRSERLKMLLFKPCPNQNLDLQSLARAGRLAKFRIRRMADYGMDRPTTAPQPSASDLLIYVATNSESAESRLLLART